MYEEYDGPLSLYHRVGPRQLARQLVDTTLTAYLDSDDFLLPNACEQIKRTGLLMKTHNLLLISNGL